MWDGKPDGKVPLPWLMLLAIPAAPLIALGGNWFIAVVAIGVLFFLLA